MTEPVTPAATPDTIDAVAGLRDGDAVTALRRARDKVLLHTRLSEAALFDPALPDLSLVERLHAARYVARRANAHALAATYRTRLLDAGGTPADTDPLQNIASSSATDVAAPTYGAVVLAVNGSTCTLLDINSGWAAAEVSGVLALLWSRYPDDNAAQVTARLLNTASGATWVSTRLISDWPSRSFNAIRRSRTFSANAIQRLAGGHFV